MNETKYTNNEKYKIPTSIIEKDFWIVSFLRLNKLSLSKKDNFQIAENEYNKIIN